MIRTDTHLKNDALDALNKIRAILSAAMYLTSTTDELDVRNDLISIAEDVAERVLEATK